MLLKTAIKYLFLDLALNTMLKWEKPLNYEEAVFKGTPRVGDRFRRIVYIDVDDGSTYTYIDCQVTLVRDAYVDGKDQYIYIEFEYYANEVQLTGDPFERGGSGLGGFVLDRAVKLYR